MTRRHSGGNSATTIIVAYPAGSCGELSKLHVVLATAAVPLLEWAGAFAPAVEPDDLAFAADTVIRLVVSHIVLPLRPAGHTADALAGLVVLLLDAARGRTPR